MLWVGTILVILVLAAPFWVDAYAGILSFDNINMTTLSIFLLGRSNIAVAFIGAAVLQGLWSLAWRKARPKGSFHMRVNWTALIIGLIFGSAYFVINLIGPPYGDNYIPVP